MPFFAPFSLLKVAASQWILAKAAIKSIAIMGSRIATSRRFAPCLVALLLSTSAGLTPAKGREQMLTGVVSRVVDGDTVWVKVGEQHGTLVKVRLLGMDAPEICQAGGVEARDALKRRALGQTVNISFQHHDDYGRTLGRVYLDDEDLGRWMVGRGHAWSSGYRSSPGPYAAEQAGAQAGRLGLFGDVNAQTPRSFRQVRPSCYP